MTAPGSRSRSARSTSAWYRRSPASPASSACVPVRSAPVDSADCVVLGGEQDLGRLLGHLAARDVDAAVEQRGGVGALGAVGGALRDRRPQGFQPGEALRRWLQPTRRRRSRSGCRGDRSGPAGSTPSRSASPSQSSARDRRRRTLPDVSPLRHSRSRDREWKCTSPVCSVAASASASSQPTISTRPSATSWTTPATRPSGPQVTEAASSPPTRSTCPAVGPLTRRPPA